MPKTHKGGEGQQKKETAAERMARFEKVLAELVTTVNASRGDNTLHIAGEKTADQLAAEKRDAEAKEKEAAALKEKEAAQKALEEAAAQKALEDAAAAKRALDEADASLEPPPKKVPSAAAGSPEQLIGVDQASVSLALNQVLGADGGSGVGEVPFAYFVAGTTVDLKLKKKIWAREFIELGALIHKPETSTSVNMAYAPGSVSQLSLTPARPRQPANIYEWVNMFSTFASIYTHKFPQEAPHLFTYIMRVMGITRSHPSSFVWRTYDEKFRRLKQYSLSLPWHILDHHILHEAQEVASATKGVDQGNRGKGGQNKSTNPRSQKFCYAYNRVAGCKKSPSSCIYRHACSNCSAQHPLHKCTKPSTPRSSAPANK